MSSPVVDLAVADLTIRRFRGLRDVELSGLGQVSILVGENDAGKTSVLEALKLYSAPESPWTWIETAGQREPRSFTSRVDRLRYLFPGEREGGQTGVEGGTIEVMGVGAFEPRGFTAICRHLCGSEAERAREEEGICGRDEFVPPDLERRGIEISVKPRYETERSPASKHEETTAERSFTFWDDQRLWSAARGSLSRSECLVITPYDHWIDRLAVLFSKAKLDGYVDAVLELVTRLDPNITGIEVIAPRVGADSVLYLRDRSAGLLPLSAFGDGLRRVLLIALGLPRMAGGLLLIDEVETAIHVSVLGEVFRWIVEASRQHEVQVVVTTHSLEALDAILAADTTPEEDVVAYRLSRAEGRVAVKRFGEDLLRRLRRDRGLDVR